MNIKIENNSLQIRQYLEILGYKWNTGDNPTEFCPMVKHNCFVLHDGKTMFHTEKLEGISFEEFKKHNPIKKEHLRSGMVVEYVNGERRLVVDLIGELMLISNEGSYPLSSYREDLTCLIYELTINKVFIVSRGHLAYMLSERNTRVKIWERPNPVTEVTLQEIAEKFNIDVKQLKIKK